METVGPTLEEARDVAVACLGLDSPNVRLAPKQGLISTVFEIRDGSRSVALKLNNEPSFETVFSEEMRCADTARKSGIPTPLPVASGRHGRCAYFATEFFEGKNCAQCSTGEILEIYRIMGRWARRFNSVEGTSFGRGPGGCAAKTPRSWKEWTAGEAARLFDTERFIEERCFSPDQFARIRASFTSIADSLSPCAASSFCHGDLSHENVMVDARGEMMLLDWGSAMESRGAAFELAPIYMWQDDTRVKYFIEGYDGELLHPRELVFFRLWYALKILEWFLSPPYLARKGRNERGFSAIRQLTEDLVRSCD